MKKSTSVKDLVDYVWNHKYKDKAFPGWTREDLERAVLLSLPKVACAWSEDERGEIDGFVLADPRQSKKELHIVGIIADSPQALARFLYLFFDLYPGWEITGKRKGKYVRLYTKRFLEKLCKTLILRLH